MHGQTRCAHACPTQLVQSLQFVIPCQLLEVDLVGRLSSLLQSSHAGDNPLNTVVRGVFRQENSNRILCHVLVVYFLSDLSIVFFLSRIRKDYINDVSLFMIDSVGLLEEFDFSITART